MGFHETVFPEDVSFGSSGGPGFNTAIIEMSGGQEQAIPRWSEARHKYNAKYGVKTYDQMAAVKTFYMARLGCANGFRYKDWHDFTTNSTTPGTQVGTEIPGPVTSIDHVCVQLTTTQFQMAKTYTDGSISRIRRITKPRNNGTAVVAKNGSTLSSGFSINYTTGIITLSSAVSPGDLITWGGQFDVPVRFDKALDENLDIVIEGFDNASANSDIPLIEMMNPGSSADEFFYGGSLELCMTASYTLSILEGRFIVVFPQSAGLSLYLPDTADVPTGGQIFFIVNEGPNSVTVKRADLSTLVTIASGSAVDIDLSVDSSFTPTWYAF